MNEVRTKSYLKKVEVLLSQTASVPIVFYRKDLQKKKTTS